MKILFILHLPPPVHGAAMVGQTIKESPFINEAFDCQYINLGLSPSIDAIGKNGIGKVSGYFSLFRQVVHQLIRFKPKVCYLTMQVYGIGFYKDLPVAILARMFGAKVVYHFHNKGVSTRQHLFLDNLLYRLAFKNADVILLSKYLYPDIQKYVPENSVHYCANGIPDKVPEPEVHAFNSPHRPFAPSPHRPFASCGSTYKSSPLKKTEVLFLSNLIESKGVYVLLEACKALQKKSLNFHCTFVGGIGDITEQQFLDKVKQSGLENFVTYAGKKYGSEKEEEFEKADIFVHPSFNDCFPLVLLEAMQHSLPVVSTFEGAIPELVEDGINGFLVQQKDANALAEKLEILVNNPELRMQMGKAGRARYETRYTLPVFENRLKDILDNVIASPRI